MSSSRSRAVVLLSGGLDSTVNLYEARERADVILALTFNYGQQAAQREIASASAITRHAGVSHKVIDLPWFSDFTRTALLGRQADIPVRDQVSIDNREVSQETAKAVWVPNRNGIFLNVAAGFAEGLGADWVVPGFNLEEAATFPDNSEEFLQALTKSFSYSTANHVRVVCFSTGLDKRQIVRRGRELNVPFDLLWSCYLALESPCGECESCQRFSRAMKEVSRDENETY